MPPDDLPQNEAQAAPDHASQSLVSWCLLPARLILLLLVGLPLIITLAYSLLTRGTYGGVTGPLTADAYLRAADPLYVEILGRSLWIAAVSTAVCLVLSLPLAWYVARYARRKTLWLNLITLPFWTSLLIRIYAWMFLLRDTGLVNSWLTYAGLTKEPLPLLYNEFAVCLGLVYSFLPAMVLPLYASLERVDPALIDAAQDLGSTPLSAALRIALPLAAPGIAAGCILVFIPALGAYLIPDLMGGGKSIMLGNLVANQFGTARDWPFGSAIAVAFTLLSAVGGLLFFRQRRVLL